MKRALVLSLVVVLGLGVGAFAQLSGSWESSLSFDLGAATFADYIVDLTSTFAMDYTVAGWTFASESGFDLHGFANQAFSVEGQLGAFEFSSKAAFSPAAASVWTYPSITLVNNVPTLCADATPVTFAPKFLSLDATASVSIAGVNASVFVLMDQSNMYVETLNYAFKIGTPVLQTSSVAWTSILTGASGIPNQNGTGAKITLSGSVAGLDITSYTYFNLKESDKRSAFCPELGKRGVFYIPVAGCGVAFTEEYVMFEGLTFGCVEFSAGLKILCTGFDSLKLVANGIDLGGWATLNIGIIFTTNHKGLDLCLTMNELSFSCITVEVGFGDANFGYVVSGPSPGTLKIDSIQIHGFGITTEVGAVTFSSFTELDIYSQLFSAGSDVPRLGIYDWMYLEGNTLAAFAVPFAGISKYTSAVASVCTDGVWSNGGADTPASFQYVQVHDGYFEVVCVATERYKLWEMFQISIDEDACCGGLFGVDIVTYFGDKEKLAAFAYDVLDATDGKNEGAVVTVVVADNSYATYVTQGDADAAMCVDSVAWDTLYISAGTTQLFNWAYTTVEFSVGMGSNLTLNLGAGISAFGWESLDLGFEFTW